MVRAHPACSPCQRRTRNFVPSPAQRWFGDSAPCCAVPRLNPSESCVEYLRLFITSSPTPAIKFVFVLKLSPVSFFFVCDLPPFGTAAMFLASPLVRPYGQVSKRSAAGASRLLLECLGPLGIIHISAPAHRRVLDRGHRRDSAHPHPSPPRREPPRRVDCILPVFRFFRLCGHSIRWCCSEYDDDKEDAVIRLIE